MDTGFNSFATKAHIHQRLAGYEQFPLHHFHLNEVFAGSKLLHIANTLALKFKHRTVSQFQLLQYELAYPIKGMRPILCLLFIFFRG